MSPRSCALGALGACGALLASWAVAAQTEASPAPNVTLAWRAPAGCPDEASVRAAIARLLAGSAERVDARAEVTRAGERWRVEVATNGGERRLEAGTCRELGDATALILAMAADPARAAANRAPAPLAVDAGEAVAVDAGAPLEAMLAPLPAVVPSAAGDAGPAVDAGAPPATDAATLTLAPSDVAAISASGVLDVGGFPQAALAPSLGLAYTPWPFRVELAGTAFLGNSGPANAAGASGRFTALALDVRACWTARLGAFDLGPCAGAEAISVRGTGLGVLQPSSGTTGWVALAGGARAAWPFARSLALTLRGELLAPLVRPDFQVDGVSLHRPAAVAGRTAAGVELRF